MKRLIVACALALLAHVAAAETVFLIGDSTVSDFSPPDPRNGWGQVIQHFFKPEVSVKNYARSGRSSKSFFEEGAWKPVAPQIQAGDYVLIQFGHNDEKRDAERGTEPFGSYQEYLSRYVDDTLKAGATPILITPVARGGLKPSTGPGSHGRFPDAVIDLAKKRQLMVIDLNALSLAYYDSLSSGERNKLFIASIDGKDDTHFTPHGAQAIAAIVAKAIRELPTPLAKQVVGIE